MQEAKLNARTIALFAENAKNLVVLPIKCKRHPPKPTINTKEHCPLCSFRLICSSPYFRRDSDFTFHYSICKLTLIWPETLLFSQKKL